MALHTTIGKGESIDPRLPFHIREILTENRTIARLTPFFSVPVAVIIKGLDPVLLAAGRFLCFGQTIDRVVFESLDKACSRDRGGRFRDIPHILYGIDRRPVPFDQPSRFK